MATPASHGDIPERPNAVDEGTMNRMSGQVGGHVGGQEEGGGPLVVHQHVPPSHVPGAMPASDIFGMRYGPGTIFLVDPNNPNAGNAIAHMQPYPDLNDPSRHAMGRYQMHMPHQVMYDQGPSSNMILANSIAQVQGYMRNKASEMEAGSSSSAHGNGDMNGVNGVTPENIRALEALLTRLNPFAHPFVPAARKEDETSNSTSPPDSVASQQQNNYYSNQQSGNNDSNGMRNDNGNGNGNANGNGNGNGKRRNGNQNQNHHHNNNNQNNNNNFNYDSNYQGNNNNGQHNQSNNNPHNNHYQNANGMNNPNGFQANGFQANIPNGGNGQFDQNNNGPPNGNGSASGSNNKKGGRGGRHQQQNERNSMISRTVYVSEVDQTVTEEQLANLFQSVGPVVDCRVCGDPNSALRFAFIEFTSEADAASSVGLTGTIMGYYPIRVLQSKTAIVPVNPNFLPRSEDERHLCARTIYVTNIDKAVTQGDVKLFFESLCGEVSRLRLLGDQPHATRIAFVEFRHADNAIAALNCSGAVMGSMPIRVSPSKTPVRPRTPKAAGGARGRGGGGNYGQQGGR
eukprot:TRINITY_DN515_c0_g1_i1.p1 TRINITY_DN515_c0_g1~~TRINITY_DN515_c0_g1_i1.p1  ORF type:complete len:570 (-),score=90.33 TRINITY_DN515_c0_g1_i1:369-2078(-)